MLFECETCESKFKRKYCLKRHIMSKRCKTVTSTTTKTFECDTCKSKFKRKYNLKCHILGKRCKTNTSTTTKSFECGACKSKFKRKYNLKCHILGERCRKTDTFTTTKSFECDTCKSKFKRKYNLKCHILGERCRTDTGTGTLLECDVRKNGFKRCALLEQSEIITECNICKFKFTTSKALKRHLSLNRCKTDQKLSCLKCESRFISKSQLRDHYEENHGILFKLLDMEFQSFEEFEKWMHDIERKNIFRFVKRTSDQLKSHTSILYQCHRSGMYIDKCANRRRKRFLKNCGSKKIQGWCPAELRVKIQSSNGICVVQYQETHIGHNVQDENELCHVYLNREEKLDLATRIAEEATIPNLKKRIYLSDATEGNSRIDFVNLKDLHNIASSHRIRGHSLPSNNDSLNVDAFINEYKQLVLYNKQQGEADIEYNTLHIDDFAIVLMSEDQESAIKTFGEKFICFDSTHSTDPHNFILHTMMIVDDSGEGKPVAFLISNRNDKTVVDIMLKNIRRKVGVIETKTIMTDMKATYYNSWIDVMGNRPEFHLFFTWHIHEDWRRNSAKIRNPAIRKIVTRKLNELAIEENSGIFEKKLSEFLGNLKNEPMAGAFSQYFSENYAFETHRWAYCYRRDAGINTNMHLRVFHQKLKRSTSGRKKVKTLYDCLMYLLDYLCIQNRDDKVKRVRKQSVAKLHTLRNRHHQTVDYLEKNSTITMHAIDDQTFVVQSFEESTEDIFKMYTVTKNESKECDTVNSACLLFCNMCGICLHKYRCDCIDSSVKNNMCKHIHAVGIVEQTCRGEEQKSSNVGERDGQESHHNDVDDSTSSRTWEEKKREIIEKYKTFLEESLNNAESEETLKNIKQVYLNPIKSSVLASRDENLK